MPVMKVYVYLRVSGKGQVDGDGFDRQGIACEAYAQQHGFQVAYTFREEGVTGESLDRPALSAMLDALASSDDVKTILVERLDRFARDLMVQEALLRDLQAKGYALVSTAEPDLCSTDPSRIFIRQVFGALAQYDKAMIVRKLRGARQRKKAKEGRCEGQKPYGFYQEERETYARILYLHGHREGAECIARTLNDEGRKPRSGEKWWPGTIRRITKRLDATPY